MLVVTGDYRYLAGSLEGDDLRLSAFDGAVRMQTLPATVFES